MSGVVQVGGTVSSWFSSTFPTLTSKVVGTVGLVLLVVLIGVGLWSIRERLTQYYPGDDIIAVESVVFTLVASTGAVALVFIWGAEGEVATALSRLPEPSATNGVLLIVAVLSLVVAYTLTRVSRGVLEDSDVGNHVMDATRQEAIHHVVQLVVYSFAVVFILALAGVNPANLLLGAGVIGVVVGFAARQTLGSVFAGFVILLARPFEVGDWVIISDQDGVVTDVSLFNTEVRSWDGERVIVPNDQVSANEIVNRSREGRLRISVDVGVDYATDIDAAATAAHEAMARLDEVMNGPTPSVVLKEFGDSAVVLECRFWIENPTAGKKWAAQTAVIGAIKTAFDDEGVKIPFPQRELTGRGEGGGFQVAATEGTTLAGRTDPHATGAVATDDGAAEDGSGDGANDSGAQMDETGDGGVSES